MEQSASLAPARSRFHVSLPILVVFFAFLVVLCWGTTVLLDPDTYMHVAVGRWIVAHHTAPHVGIFSGTMPNAPWVADEWLAQAILGLLYDIWGWSGLVLATALSFAAALGLLTRYLLRWFEPVHALIGTISAAVVTWPHVWARPHIFTLPIMVVWFGQLVGAREHGRSPAYWLLPLMTLWANLHGGFVVGLVFIGIFAGEAVILAKTTIARLALLKQWLPFGFLAILAAVITPYGVHTLWLPFHLMRMKFALSAILEWQSPDFEHFQLLEVWLLAAITLALVYGVRVPLTRIAMILLLLHMTLAHRRDADYLGFLTPLLVGETIRAQMQSRALQRLSSLDKLFRRLAEPAHVFGTFIAVAALLIVSAGYLAIPLVRPPDPNAPIAAVEAAREDGLIGGRVLNEYGFGDYLIFSGVAPFIDGRAELYGDAFLKRYQQAIWGITDDLPKLLDEYQITWAIFSTRSYGATLMAHFPDWRRIYAGRIAVVYARINSTAETSK